MRAGHRRREIADRAADARHARRRPSTATTSGPCATTAAEAVERARARRRPAVPRVADLPLRRPLAQPTRRSYRKPGELEHWLARDPLLVARARPARALRRRPRTALDARRARGRGADRRAVVERGARPRRYPDPATTAPTEFAERHEPTLEFRDAIRDALAEELERDERVVFFGEDVAAAGGVFDVTPGLRRALRRRPRLRHADLRARARRRRLRRAVTRPAPGHRDHVRRLHGAGRWTASSTRRPSTGTSPTSRRSVPLVVRSAVGGGGRFGAIHSQIPATWFQGVPGLKIVVPVDAGRRQGPAQGGDPRRQPGPLPRAQAPVLDQGRGRRRASARSARRAVVREGADVTIVSRRCKGVHDALAAAETLAGDGIDAEVIDLRTLRPLDVDDGPRARSRRPTGSSSSRRARAPAAGPARLLARRGRGGPARPRRRLAHRHAPTTRSPTARRSRTPSSPAPTRSRRPSGRSDRRDGYGAGHGQQREAPGRRPLRPAALLPARARGPRGRRRRRGRRRQGRRGPLRRRLLGDRRAVRRLLGPRRHVQVRARQGPGHLGLGPGRGRA